MRKRTSTCSCPKFAETGSNGLKQNVPGTALLRTITKEMRRSYGQLKTLLTNGLLQDPNNQRQRRSSDTESLLTIGLLYYSRPSRLLRQLETLQSYPVEIQKQLTLLIVDDGSPKGLRAMEYIQLLETSGVTFSVKIRIVYVLKDIPFNHGGARNLACYLSETEKILLLDLDMLIDTIMIQQILQLSLVESNTDGNHIYKSIAHRFNRIRPTTNPDTGTNDGLHPAVMLVNVSTYWNSGGCDEDFVGSYGFTDKHFWYKWNLDVNNKGLVDHYDIYLKEFAINGCNFTTSTSSNVMTQIPQTQIGICKNALEQLKVDTKSVSKRKPKINKEKLDYKIKTGCWSNFYLNFPWIIQR